MARRRYKISRPISDPPVIARVATWENGLRCLHHDSPQGNVVEQLYILTGSRHYPWGWTGLPHFAEHVITTRKRGMDERIFANKLDSLGEAHAHTTEDTMLLACECIRRRWREPLLFFHSILKAQTKHLVDYDLMRSQRAQIRHEILEKDAEPLSMAERLFYGGLWPNSSAGQPPIGTVSQLKKFDPIHLLGYFQESFVGSRIFVSVGGVASHFSVFKYVDSLFGGLLEGEKAKFYPRSKRSGSGIILRPMEQCKHAAVIIGQSLSAKRKSKVEYNESATHEILQQILGGLYSSEFNLRTWANGNSYSVEAEMSSSHLMVCAYVEPKQINLTIEGWMTYLTEISRKGVDQRRFDRAVNQLCLHEGHYMDAPRTRLHQASNALIDGADYPTYREKVRDYQKVRRADLQDYVRRHLRWNKFLLVVAGRLNGFVPSDRIRRWCGQSLE